jgi:hypothetical protein
MVGDGRYSINTGEGGRLKAIEIANALRFLPGTPHSPMIGSDPVGSRSVLYEIGVLRMKRYALKVAWIYVW